MKLIRQSAELWGTTPIDYYEMMAWVARAGRTCYLSEPKGDDEAFVLARLKPDPPHASILEHSNLPIRFSGLDFFNFVETYPGCLASRWLRTNVGAVAEKSPMCECDVVGNVRAWAEALGKRTPREVYDTITAFGGRPISLHQLPRKFVRVTAGLVTDRAILAEITRHRDDVGFSVESQRYVKYDSPEGISFIEPAWWEGAMNELKDMFIRACKDTEWAYKRLRQQELSAQHARVVLSNQVKTTIVMTAYLDEWDWIFKLRRGPGAYPQMISLMNSLHGQFKRAGLVS